MVRHIVAWSFKDGFSVEEKNQHRAKIKAGLEALVGRIDGLVEMKVCTDPLTSSTSDMLLNSLFESEQALKAYQIHPEHKKVSAFVGEVMESRICLDYED